MDVLKNKRAVSLNGNNVELMKILDATPELVHKRDFESLTPLHYAAWYNNADAVDALLEFGAGLL